jgi:cysteine synthase A
MIIKNGIELIGNTPMLKVKNHNIYIKLEKYNLGGSIKDRAALNMIEDAEKKAILKKGSIIIEPTSGNTGISLALIGRLKGYKVVLVMPDSMSEERRQLIKASGAELILTEGKLGMKGSINKARELSQEDSKYFVPSQFDNKANMEAHYKYTSEEILNELGDVDVFTAGVGTGGTFTGISKRLKEVNPEVYLVPVEPETSAVLSGEEAGSHKIQGIGAGFIPSIYDDKYADEIIKVSYENAKKEAVKFSRETGILVGISTGANIYSAKLLDKRFNGEKKIATISPDGGEKYLSTDLFK